MVGGLAFKAKARRGGGGDGWARVGHVQMYRHVHSDASAEDENED